MAHYVTTHLIDPGSEPGSAGSTAALVFRGNSAWHETSFANGRHDMATLHHQVWIDAPVKKVYEALASAEGLGKWWAPHTSTETDEGLILAHSPGPAHGDVKMKVLDSTPHSRIEWEIVSTHPARSPASAWTGTHIIFEISERESPGHWQGMDNEGEKMAILNFHHTGWDEDSEFLGFCNYAWGVTLDMLRQWCESQS